jgi:hypothetical protein
VGKVVVVDSVAIAAEKVSPTNCYRQLMVSLQQLSQLLFLLPVQHNAFQANH